MVGIYKDCVYATLFFITDCMQVLINNLSNARYIYYILRYYIDNVVYVEVYVYYLWLATTKVILRI